MKDIIKSKCTKDNYQKLEVLGEVSIFEFLSPYVSLCNPKSIFVCTDSGDDLEYIKNKALELGEERTLDVPGHRVHFDGYFDQARDKNRTKYLLPRGKELGSHINSIDKEEGIEEVRGHFKDIMKDKEMIVGFFCLGPLNSKFSLFAVQLTDSYYVIHSENILYRNAYRLFKGIGAGFFKFIHSAGELENHVSKNIDKRRVYIDIEENTVYSINTQYAGNTLGLKKLALRLAVNKASREGWLAEHMFIMGIKGIKDRKTYFVGAFPSGCGKTSTAMLKGHTIVGDDIAYLKEQDGKVYAVNPEVGVFGILQDVNKENDPLIWEAVTKSGEVIFTNVLISEDGTPRWLGDGRPLPQKGINFSGDWYPGKKDSSGKEIPYAHKNARYTVSLKTLSNCDPELDNPNGVEIGGIIYGGRDSDTWPPVCESFDWAHGVITFGASLESEVTFATLDKEGERKFNPFSNLDFLSISIGKYIEMYLNFGEKLKNPPQIFAVNYFLRDEKKMFLNSKEDKHVWIVWMQRRAHNEVEAIRCPIGLIPKYQDLQYLFKKILKRDYSQEDYTKQFSLRVDKNLAKIHRIKRIYQAVADTPRPLFDVLDEQTKRLEIAQAKFGEIVAPHNFKDLWNK